MIAKPQSLPIATADDILRLPKEHGAVVVFSLACIISLLLCRDNLPTMALCEVVLWTMILSLHRSTQLLVVTFLGMVVLFLYSPLPLSLWIAVVCAGSRVTSSRSSKIHTWLREVLGLTGAISAPIMASYVITQDFHLHLTVAGVLVCATLTGTALIRASHREMGVTPHPVAAVSFLLWIFLTASNPLIVSIVLIPYVAQSIWILKVPKPSLKQLGQAQCLCLLWVSIILALHVIDMF